MLIVETDKSEHFERNLQEKLIGVCCYILCREREREKSREIYLGLHSWENDAAIY